MPKTKRAYHRRVKTYYFDVVVQATTKDRYSVAAFNKQEALNTIRQCSALGGKLLRAKCYKVVKHAAS